MAEVQRKRTLINPARKRKRNPKRKLSPKQIAIFGSKRQKAALKASRKRKRNASAKRHSPARRNAAPAKRRRSPKRTTRVARRQSARRKNPGGIVEVALNPATPKRRKSVARTKKRKSSSRRRTYKHRRTNPAPVARRHRRRRSVSHRKTRRRNPSRSASMGGVSNLIVSAAYAIGGAVSSKYLTQMVLGSSNVGYMGYGANLAAAFVGGKALGMFIKNKQAENSFILGGVIMTLIRFLSDQTPLGSTLQQYGLGDYEASTWLSPARYANAATSAAIDIPTALRPQIAAPRGAGMSGLRGSGTYSRTRGTY